VAAHEATNDVWECMFTEHSSEHTHSPMFAMQSQYVNRHTRTNSNALSNPVWFTQPYPPHMFP
jgi:hypothetical protein